MKLLYCAVCDVYTKAGEFDFATRQRGKVEIQDDGSVLVLLGSGGKALPDSLPWARVQTAYCLDCGGTLTVEDVEPCPHISAPSDAYWRVYNDKPPYRICQLCGTRQTATYVWPD